MHIQDNALTNQTKDIALEEIFYYIGQEILTSNNSHLFLQKQVKGLVSTTLRIDAVTEANFKTDYFVVYVNKHSTTTRKQAILNQGKAIVSRAHLSEL